MPLLGDYAITPDVFDVSSYSNDEVCGLHVQTLKDGLLAAGLVRDLRGGEWHGLFSRDTRAWHIRAKELLKKMATQGRLVPFGPVLEKSPTDDREWCDEALGTGGTVPFTGGVIVTESVKTAYKRESLVVRVDRLAGAPWWAARSSSVSLARSLSQYQTHLDPILRCSNSLMFIDPHLDPTRYGYREFSDLVACAGRRTPPPTIEVHRVCYEGSGRNRNRLDAAEIESRMRSKLEAPGRAVGLRIEVFVWDDFHDRFLISNLVGVSLPNGFDTTRDPNSITRWTRLGRDDRDDVQREFDPASERHTLRHRFQIG